MNTTHLFRIFILLLFIALAGCRKAIDIKIPFNKEIFVIEGAVNDNSATSKVLFSKVIPIDDSNHLEGIAGAVITIAEDNKTPVRLNDSGDGVYEGPLKGSPGHSYHLTVKINGEVFTATSVMPEKVVMDSIFVSERLFLGKQRKIGSVAFKDPPGKGNAYRFVQYVNGKMDNNIFVINDNLIDGNAVIYDLLFFDQEYTLVTDDQLRVVMRTIDVPTYKYYNSLVQSALGQPHSSSPGNPVTNIIGGASGYFSAYTFDAKNIVVQ